MTRLARPRLYRGSAYVLSSTPEDNEPRRIGFQSRKKDEPRRIGFRIEQAKAERCPTCRQPQHPRSVSTDSTGVAKE